MSLPVQLSDPIVFWRGDKRTLTFNFWGPPPAWVSGHSYVVGAVGSGTYLANSTVTYQGTRYTCLTANSDAVFDPTKWVADTKAVGPGVDLTSYGSVFTGQLRDKPGPGGVLMASFVIDASNATTGQLLATIMPASWATVTGNNGGFDVQADNSSGTATVTLVASKAKYQGDYTRV